MKLSVCAILMVVSISCYAQRFSTYDVSIRRYNKWTLGSIRKNYPQACHFYQSLKDYKNNNPVPGVDWQPGSWKTDKINVLRKGGEEKTEVSELEYRWITDEQGLIMRIVGDDMYFLIVDGHYCYYIQYGNGYAYLKEDGTLLSGSNQQGNFYEFVSEGLDGEMVKLYDNLFMKMIKEHGLMDSYKANKPEHEKKDTVVDWNNKQYAYKMRYFAKINETYKKN